MRDPGGLDPALGRLLAAIMNEILFRSGIRSTGSRSKVLWALSLLLESSCSLEPLKDSWPGSTSSGRFSSRCGKRHRHRSTSRAGVNLRPAMTASPDL